MTTHSKYHADQMAAAIRHLDRIPGAVDVIADALHLRAREHDQHAATMRQAEAAGGVPGFMTAEAARRVAECHESSAADVRSLADLIDGIHLGEVDA